MTPKLSTLTCPATLDQGVLTLDDGTYIDLNEVYAVMAELREYAENATLGEDALPQCVHDADKLLGAFS